MFETQKYVNKMKNIGQNSGVCPTGNQEDTADPLNMLVKKSYYNS